MSNSNTEPTLAEIAQQLTEMRSYTKEQFAETRAEIAQLKATVEKLDSRLFDFTMRVVSVNQSAFYSVGLAILSAASPKGQAALGGIAFVVARVSSGSGLHFCQR